MLKTTEQQDQTSDDYGYVRIVPVEDRQTAQITPAKQVLEPESFENIQSLVDEFTAETKRRRRRWWVSWAVTAGSIAPLFGLIAYLIARAPMNYLPVLTGSSLLLALISFVLPISAMSLVRPTKKQRSITDTLIASSDVRAVDQLMAGLGTADKATRDLMVAALIKLLPRLRECDNLWLSGATHRGLVWSMGWAHSGLMRKYYGKLWADFVISDIKALASVGDGRALGPLEALASGIATTDDAKRIQHAAIECLEPLRKRVERDRGGQHLLRPSAQPDSQVDLLLVPATEIPVADARELPRPSGPN